MYSTLSGPRYMSHTSTPEPVSAGGDTEAGVPLVVKAVRPTSAGPVEPLLSTSDVKAPPTHVRPPASVRARTRPFTIHVSSAVVCGRALPGEADASTAAMARRAIQPIRRPLSKERRAGEKTVN